MTEVESSRSPKSSKTRSLTVAALLGVFILAVFLAVASHFLPGRLSGMVRRAMDQHAGTRP
jgi:small-conductance mechanosensitive channel